MAASRSSLRPEHIASASSIINGLDQLPGGACNFRELARGTKSPVCGCKRFWLNLTNSATQPGVSDNAWCFCGHHACFHNAVSQHAQRLVSEQASALPAAQHTEDKPVRSTPDGYISVHQAGAVSLPPAGLGIRPDSRSQSQSINTRIWDALNGFARGQEGSDDNSTRLPSTVVSFTGDVTTAPRPMGPPVFIPVSAPSKPGCDDFQGSATEVATPSIAGTPDLQAYVPPASQTCHSPARQALATVASPKHCSPVGSGNITHSELAISSRRMPSEEIMNMLQAHAQRLAALESLSFSQIPIEEVQDKFELFDGRLLDLEQWRGENEDRARRSSEEALDNTRHILAKSRKRRLLPAETSSFASDESFDIAAAVHAETAVIATIATNAEIGPRIESLETRVADLERTALPSYTQPWEVEVVLLPWGRSLRGIWFSSNDATQHSMRSSNADLDEWTGAQSQLKTSFRSSSSAGAWTTESIQAWAEDAQDWLSAKACGPAGSVFQRLASRGFVRNVSISNSDPRHVCDTIAGAFKDILDSTPTEHGNDVSRYLALRQSLIPLRKIRKSTRLRFLSPSEMITPAVWNARFFESSIFMKVGDGQRRLYITTPHAYLQGAYDGLNWQKIRQLSPRDINGEVQAGQVDPTIAIEACWSYNDKLDYVASLNTSFASHTSHQSAWSIKSQQSPSEQGQGVGQLTPALSGQDPSVAHNRTMSLPGSASGTGNIQASLPKRRVASFETMKSIPIVTTGNMETSKRRRLSDSQEAEKRGVNFTPRWSREPPSPFYSEQAADIHSQAASSSRKRGNTPFAYATPHSNSHFVDRVEILGDGDTEHDSDAFEDDRADEEEWNGMDAAASHAEDADNTGTSAEDIEYSDDDSLDADGSLYEEHEDMSE